MLDVRWGPLLLLLWQLSHALVAALSSSSPPDLFASPAYRIVLHRQLISNESATELVQAQGGESMRYELMRTKGGIGFLCAIPVSTTRPVALQQAPAQPAPTQDIVNATASLEKGLALLEPLKRGCLYQKAGWFTCRPCTCISSFRAQARSQTPSVTAQKFDSFTKSACKGQTSQLKTRITRPTHSDFIP